MAYTIERLQRVKELICSKRTVGINSHDACKYSLRRRRTQTAALLSTWIDDDEDDDTYEPESRVCSKRKRSRQSDPATTRSTKRNRSGRLIVTMKLTSEAGKAFLASLPIHQDENPGQEDEMWKNAEEMMAVLDSDETAPTPEIKDPNAQPCAMCMTFELDCLLIKDPYAYPCHVCADMGIKCELLVKPEWKKACENCKIARKTCSYDTDDTGHDLPCTACQASREDCAAGPARHRPVPSPATPMRVITGSSSKNPPGCDSLPKEAGNRAATRIIRTALAHPVNFSYVPPTDGSNPCHWCDDFAFGLVGLGTRQVEVLDSGDGRLIEVGGGHVIEGHEPSRMCVTCALERIHIMQCPGHRMGSLKGYDPATFDFDAAYASLVADPGEAARRPANPWCSLCIAPAFYGCRAIQSVNVYQEPVDPQCPEAIGCGLLLCEKCDMLLRASRGDVRRVVRKNETAGGETEGRADVGYVMPGNAMWRAQAHRARRSQPAGGVTKRAAIFGVHLFLPIFTSESSPPVPTLALSRFPLLRLPPRSSPRSPRAATRRAQLTVTTSSTKRRKVAEPRRPGAAPGLSFASPSQTGRRHGQAHHANTLPPQPSRPPNRPVSAASTPSQTASPSPPRYIPAHLQDEVLGTRFTSQSPPPDSLDSPPDMSSSDHDASRSPSGRSSPGVKLPTSDDDVDMATAETASSAPPQPPASDPMDTNDDDDDNLYPTPASMSAATGTPSAPSGAPTTTDPLPSYDDQVAQVTRHMMIPPVEGQKGYVVSMSWLKRVMSRSSTHASQGDKTSMEGEVGRVDNSDLVLVTDPANAGLKDEAGQPFVPLRPGLQITEDYEVVPQDAWDLMMKWYGLAEQSPTIVRYAHNTSPNGEAENIQFEINPPIFTILKLANPSAGISPQTLREKSMKPARTLASRHTSFQKWLRDAKGLANIDMSTKVRVWKILGGLGSATASAAITPAASRSASPAPAASMVANAGGNLVLDLNTFLSLSEGAQRELVEGVKDQTNNPNYNGKMSLDLCGLGGSDVVVLEEQISNSGEFASEASKKQLNRLGVPSGNLKTEVSTKLQNKSPTTSGRSSPVLEPIRGRRKDGKPRGNTGLSNLGNTCYMNSALQCVRSVEELSYYFLNDVYKKDLNPSNPLAHNGEVAKSYANLLRLIYDENGQSSFAPRQLKHTIGRYGPAFSGYGQQDSQEFLLFLLDGLQEDLNRIQKKPYIEKPDSTDEMVTNRAALEEFADKCWEIYKARNDSVITDLFAGMYKSTLVCPVCDKVSIIFDPFNNLTLQLPIENLWSKQIFYFALNKKPVVIDVEIDKNASIKALKEMVAKKMNSDAQRLIMCDMYKYKFYKMFDNTASIADSQITHNDDIAIFEVESVPTNYNPDKAPRAYFSYSRSSNEEIPKFESPKADRLLVPVFHRYEKPRSGNGKNPQRTIFGFASYILVTREENYDYDTIFRKVLDRAATMTTRDFLNEDEPQDASQEDSDTVIMNDDDAQSADSKIKTSSVDGEDGMVDVSMRDASDQGESKSSQSSKSPFEDFDSSIPARFRNLFTLKIMKGQNEVVPLGWSSLDDNKEYPRMAFRRKTKPAVAPVSGAEKRGTDDDSDQEKSGGSGSDTDSDSVPRTTAKVPEVQTVPFIRPGEGIVVDWTEEAHDALFTGDPRDRNPIRGAPTWTNVDHLPDPELTKKRQLRTNRRKKGVSLDECLDEFNKEEILSENDAWYCPRCKEHRRASKKFELWKTPDILVMHLKRFSASRGFRDKLDVLVDFPVEGLDMTGRVESPEEGKSLIYDLFAVDNHYGGLGGGHYTAYAKNFMTGQWNEYNDSSVSRPLDPQSVVTSSAYLLFYRRRSDRPLGGKVLEEITESSTRPTSEADGESRGPSPSGNGRRLGGSSLNGSSSALAGAGAARQLGDGGLQTGARTKNQSDDSPPEYSSDPMSGEKRLDGDDQSEGMNYVADFSYGGQSDPFRSYNQPPFWSFDRDTDAHGHSQMTTTLPGSTSEDDDLLDDDASNTAVGGGDLSDSDLNLISLTGTPAGQGVFPGTPMEEKPLSEFPLQSDADDDDNDDLPVVELRVDDD